MSRANLTYRLIMVVAILIAAAPCAAQTISTMQPLQRIMPDSALVREAVMVKDSLDREFQAIAAEQDSSPEKYTIFQRDSLLVASFDSKITDFTPVPRKATLFALIPGGGQIYNHKYWKLPIVYGGFMGCIYALTWNGQMYSDYKQAYLDIMDTDPDTKSYEDFLPPSYDIASNETWLKSVLKNRKDRYRRYRDMSIFAFAGVYAISIIDAYVDAELSHFDISDDLSLRLSPTLLDTRTCSLGMNFSFDF